MTVFTGQYWADRPKVSKEQLAAYILDLAWHGLSQLDSKPQLFFRGAKAREGGRAPRPKRESDSGSRIQSRRVLPNRIPSTPPGRFRVAEHAFRGTGYATLCRVRDEVLRFEQETEHNDPKYVGGDVRLSWPARQRRSPL